MGKTCKKCNKPNFFAKVCRSQQVSKITEDSDKLEGECTLVVEEFGSCEESEIMPVQANLLVDEKISRCVREKTVETKRTSSLEEVQIQKIDLLRDPKSNKVKSLKTMVLTENRIIQ